MAATGVLLAACADSVAVADVVLAEVVEALLDGLDVLNVLDALDMDVEPPVAWYALFWSSRFSIAGSRSPSGQPDWAQALVLQQPQKVSVWDWDFSDQEQKDWLVSQNWITRLTFSRRASIELHFY
jgi:hypothetical protein